MFIQLRTQIVLYFHIQRAFKSIHLDKIIVLMEGELWMDKYARFKLKIDAKPSLFHKHTVRKVIGERCGGKSEKKYCGIARPYVVYVGINLILIKYTGSMFTK